MTGWLIYNNNEFIYIARIKYSQMRSGH